MQIEIKFNVDINVEAMKEFIRLQLDIPAIYRIDDNFHANASEHKIRNYIYDYAYHNVMSEFENKELLLTVPNKDMFGAFRSPQNLQEDKV